MLASDSQSEEAWWLSPLVLAFAVLAGVSIAALHMPYPLRGDQALFLLGGREIANGATLYVDFWDNKQPGIYWFYAIAGELCGFSAMGVHIFEAVWLAVAAAFLTWAVAVDVRHRWVAMLTPLMTIGLFYWIAAPGFLTQVEILVTLPLATCFALGAMTCRNPMADQARLFAFGFSAAVVAAFKLVLVIVPVTMWLATAWHCTSRERRDFLAGLPRLLWAPLLGGLLGLGLIAFYFGARGAMDEFIWTTFCYPAAAADEVPGRPIKTLFRSARWLFPILVPLALVGIFAVFDLTRERLRRSELMALGWLMAGSAAIVVQWFSWWAYHFSLLMVPAGVLTVNGLDRLVGRGRLLGRGRHAIIAVLGFSALPFILPPQLGMATLRAAWTARGANSLEAYRASIDPEYQRIRDSVAFLRSPKAMAGDIYVFGEPGLVLESGRRYAIPTHGWSWEMLLESQWRKLPGQLRAAMPAYVYMSSDYSPLVRERSPEVERLLEEDYAIAAASDSGTWYARR